MVVGADGEEWLYMGELDAKGKAFGIGTSYRTNKKGERITFDGMFRNDLAEGFATYTVEDGDRWEGEWSEGKKKGKCTLYWKNGDVFNQLYDEKGKYKKMKDVTSDPSQAFFKDGKPWTALENNFKKYI